jgi:hypothetical protein
MTKGSQAYQIIKIVCVLELVMVSRNNRATVRGAGCVGHLQEMPPVAGVQKAELLGSIERSTDMIHQKEKIRSWRILDFSTENTSGVPKHKSFHIHIYSLIYIGRIT